MRVIIFELVQPTCQGYINVTDGWTTYYSNTALALRASLGKNNAKTPVPSKNSVLNPAPTRLSCFKKYSRVTTFLEMASIWFVHFMSLATCTQSSFNVATFSTGAEEAPSTVEQCRTDKHFLRFTAVDNHACFSGLHWTSSSSSTNDCMQLPADLFKISVIVVSSTYLCVIHAGCSESIRMTHVSGPRYDPCGIPADINIDKVINSNLGPVLPRFRDTAGFLFRTATPTPIPPEFWGVPL